MHESATLVVWDDVTTRHGSSSNGASVIGEGGITLSDLLREGAETQDTTADVVDGVDVQSGVVALAELGLHGRDATARCPSRIDGTGGLNEVERDSVRRVGSVDDVHLLGNELILQTLLFSISS